MGRASGDTAAGQLKHIAAELYKVYSKSRADKPADKPGPSEKKAAEPATSVDNVTPRKARPVEIFKTPVKPSPADTLQARRDATGPPMSQTDFAFAPSPSRLRALAASRSFSGSPNSRSPLKPTPFDAARPDASTFSPRSLGRTIVVPRKNVADTPRTKALKWLSGDAITSPVKPKRDRKGGDTASSSRLNETRSLIVSGFEETGSTIGAASQARQLSPKRASQEVDMQTGPEDDPEEIDFLAPSPVKGKPVIGMDKGKGKQRFVDLLGEADSLPQDPLPNTSQHSSENGRARAAASFFAPAEVPIKADEGQDGSASNLAQASQSEGYARPRKRKSTKSTLTPFDSLEDELAKPVEQDASTARNSESNNAAKPTATSAGKFGGDGQKAKEPVKKRSRKESAALAKMLEEADEDEDAIFAELHGADGMQTDEPSAKQATDDEEYETQDLDVEYGTMPKEQHSKSAAVAMLESQVQLAESNMLHESLDVDLVSLLSLRSSPVKNRLAKLHKKRDETVKALLREPTYLIAQKREKQKKGLEDLDDDDAWLPQRRPGGEEDFEDIHPSGGMPDEAEVFAEASDDDWASEPEGWKDLGDGEMDDL